MLGTVRKTSCVVTHHPCDSLREILLFSFYRSYSQGMERSSNLAKLIELIEADLGIKPRQSDHRVSILHHFACYVGGS